MNNLILAGLLALSACAGGHGIAGDTSPDSVAYSDLRPPPSGDVIYGTDLRSANEPDLVQAIVHRVPGARIVFVGGQAQLHLRPKTSIYGDASPLVVLDGMPMSSAGLSVLRSINVQNVERVEILRRTDDTALYGVQGGNGVIRVWTRSGFSREGP